MFFAISPILDMIPNMTPKWYPNGFQNRSKIDQKSIKLALGPQEAPRAPQEPSKTPRGHLGDIVLGRGFGRVLGPCWPQEPPKSHSKCIQNFHRFWCPFFIDFSSILEGFWEGFGRYVGLQKALKIKLQCWLDFWSIFYRFLWILEGPNPYFWQTVHAKSLFFKICYLTVFSDFYRFWEPCWPPKPT